MINNHVFQWKPKEMVGAPTWPPFLCLGAPTWRPWRHMKTENWALGYLKWTYDPFALSEWKTKTEASEEWGCEEGCWTFDTLWFMIVFLEFPQNPLSRLSRSQRLPEDTQPSLPFFRRFLFHFMIIKSEWTTFDENNFQGMVRYVKNRLRIKDLFCRKLLSSGQTIERS